MTHDVFICHSSEDRTIANAICSHLEQNRIRCWIAPRDVVPGSDYAQSIVEAIAETKITVLVFSHSSNQSPHVKREIERSVSHGIPILPFRVEDVVPSPSLEYFISDSHWLDAVTPPMEEHLEYLAGTVRMLLDRAFATESTAVGAAEPSVQTGAVMMPAVQAPLIASAGPPPGGSGSPASRRRWVIPVAVGAVAVTAVGVAIALSGGGGGVPAATEMPQPTAAATVPADGGDSAPPSEEVSDGVEAEFYDEFEGMLSEGWAWHNEDPGSWRLVDSFLEIDAADTPPITNLLLRDLPDDTTALQTYVKFRPTLNYQLAGIVLAGEDPESDRIQFGRAFCDHEWCAGDALYLDVFEGGELVSSGEGIPLEDVEGVYLDLDISGDTVSAWYMIEGEDEFRFAAEVTWDGSHTRIGLAAHQAPEPVTAAFDYVLLYDNS
ncbi:MAG: toll/interleukin-1 receptor domain-containing protein [Actinobacteria bacterium]|nr:toll/interleukin-1 receptor domain-containing protein [Actinomycetota bacterium]